MQEKISNLVMPKKNSPDYGSELHTLYAAADRVRSSEEAWTVLKKGAQVYDGIAVRPSVYTYLTPAVGRLNDIYVKFRGKLTEHQRKRFERAHKRVRRAFLQELPIPIVIPDIPEKLTGGNGIRQYAF